MSENIKENQSELDILCDEVLASEQTIMEQTMIDLSGVSSKSPKDTAKSTLFDTDPESDLAYINDVMNNSNFVGSKKNEKPTPKPIEVKEEAKQESEFKQFDEEINYRKKLDKIMKRSTPTEPFTMKVIKDDDISTTTGEDPLVLNEEDNFEYFSHDQIGKFDKISVRTYSNEDESLNYSPYLLKNKLLFFTMLIVFGIYLVEIGIFFLFMRKLIEVNSIYYLCLLLIAMVPLGFGVFKYSLDPNLKVKSKINFLNMALNSVIVVVLATVIILIIALLNSISILEFSDLLPNIIIPIIMILNYPIGIVVYYYLYKSERFYEI